MNFFESLQNMLNNPTVKVGVDNQSINQAITKANATINNAIIKISVAILLIAIIIILTMKYVK